MKKLIHVAAAVILDHQGQILLARRPADKHQGGLWEFPGGKVEAGEPVVEALKRELDEELGIQLSRATPLIRIPHHYPDKSVLLDVYTVRDFAGEPWGKEGQPVRWVPPSELSDYSFPAANRPIVTAALLASRMAITPPSAAQLTPAQLTARLTHQCQQYGLTQLMLRLPGLDAAQYAERAREALAWAAERGVALILNCSLAEAEALRAPALHLSSARLAELESRQQFSGRWLGASCHTPQELAMAVEKGLDYVTLSAVQPTRSHPGAPHLGWTQFEQWVADMTLPVYALGGVGEAELAQAREAGAQGVAGIRDWWPED